MQVDIERIVPVTDARDNFNKIIDEVEGTDHLYVLTKNGKPSAVVVGVNHLEKLTGDTHHALAKKVEESNTVDTTKVEKPFVIADNELATAPSDELATVPDTTPTKPSPAEPVVAPTSEPASAPDQTPTSPMSNDPFISPPAPAKDDVEPTAPPPTTAAPDEPTATPNDSSTPQQ